MWCPTGLYLGTTTILLYINDFTNAHKNCIIHQFSNDTNLIYRNKSPSEISHVKNKELRCLTNLVRSKNFL